MRPGSSTPSSPRRRKVLELRGGLVGSDGHLRGGESVEPADAVTNFHEEVDRVEGWPRVRDRFTGSRVQDRLSLVHRQVLALHEVFGAFADRFEPGKFDMALLAVGDSSRVVG